MIEKLIDQHGREMSLPDLRAIPSADCEHKAAVRRKDRCLVYYPQLRELKGGIAEASGSAPQVSHRGRPRSESIEALRQLRQLHEIE